MGQLLYDTETWTLTNEEIYKSKITGFLTQGDIKVLFLN